MNDVTNPDANVEDIIDKAQGREVKSEQTEANQDADLWSDFDRDLDNDSDDNDGGEAIVEAKKEEVITPPKEEQKPAPQPAAEPKTVEVPVTPPVEVAPQQPDAPAQEPPKAETPPVKQETPEEFKKRQHETRAKAIEELEKTYTLSEEDATTFLTSPEKVVPKFRAELFMDVFDAVTKSMMQAIPALITQVQQVQKATSSAEDAFYAANPLLDRTKHSDMVNLYANAYMKVKPDATPEQLTRDVGVQVMYALGIDPTKVQKKQEPAAPVTPAPYVPPGVGGGLGGNSQTKGDGNIWGSIAEELISDD